MPAHGTIGQVNGRGPAPLSLGRMSNWKDYFTQDLVCLHRLECGGQWSGEQGQGLTAILTPSLLVHGWFMQFPGGKVPVL